MANTVTNFLEVVGTEEVKAAMDELFNNAGGYADTTQFVNTFYGTEFEGGVSHDWLFENVGAKWIYVENEIGEGEWNISSAGYTHLTVSGFTYTKRQLRLTRMLKSWLSSKMNHTNQLVLL